MYAKLYGTILNSSLWAEDAFTCKLFITMLVMADREGFIYGSIVGLARQSCMEMGIVEASLRVLMEPDDNSADLVRNPENEGRRVERTESGWRILNYGYYRDMRDMDTRRAQNREAQRRKREAGATSAPVSKRQHRSALVSGVSPSEAAQLSSEVERESVGGAEPPPRTRKVFVRPTVEEVDGYILEKYPEMVNQISGAEFVAEYEARGWRYGKSNTPMKSWRGALYAAWIAPRQRGQR